MRRQYSHRGSGATGFIGLGLEDMARRGSVMIRSSAWVSDVDCDVDCTERDFDTSPVKGNGYSYEIRQQAKLPSMMLPLPIYAHILILCW